MANLGDNPYYDPQKQPVTRQRRPQNALPETEIRDLLNRGQIVRIGTRWDDQPFVTPTTYWFDEARHRIVFHSNVVGRIRANSERHTHVCAEVSEWGKFLPSNDPLELTLQYRSVLAFGQVSLIDSPEEARAALGGLVAKYFPQLHFGREMKPIDDAQLKRTSVYEIHIQDWSGKENWANEALQAQDWPALP
ncbi:MAG: pyridoxamine 5'-phosphate oxidase family protein [Deinococcaceae bacterium]